MLARSGYPDFHENYFVKAFNTAFFNSYTNCPRLVQIVEAFIPFTSKSLVLKKHIHACNVCLSQIFMTKIYSLMEWTTRSFWIDCAFFGQCKQKPNACCSFCLALPFLLFSLFCPFVDVRFVGARSNFPRTYFDNTSDLANQVRFLSASRKLQFWKERGRGIRQ